MATTQPVKEVTALVGGTIDAGSNAEFFGCDNVRVGSILIYFDKGKIVPVKSFFPAMETQYTTREVTYNVKPGVKYGIMEFRRSITSGPSTEKRLCMQMYKVGEAESPTWDENTELKNIGMPDWDLIDLRAENIARELNRWVRFELIPGVPERPVTPVAPVRCTIISKPTEKASTELENRIPGLDQVQVADEPQKPSAEAPEAPAEPKRPKAKKDRGKKLSWEVKAVDPKPVEEPIPVKPETPAGSTVTLNLGTRQIQVTEEELQNMLSDLFRAKSQLEKMKVAMGAFL